MDYVISLAVLVVLEFIGAGWFVWKIEDELSKKYGKDDDDYWK